MMSGEPSLRPRDAQKVAGPTPYISSLFQHPVMTWGGGGGGGGCLSAPPVFTKGLGPGTFCPFAMTAMKTLRETLK